jgi:predicted nucleotidyltransferase component of viral defense system
MIDDSEIEAKAEEFRLRPLEVQKDYVYGWLLYAIVQRPVLSQQLILKGGNALRKAYLPDTRLSKDLDFSAKTTVPRDVLERELMEVRTLVTERTGVQFTDQNVRGKDLAIPEVEAVEARLYFRSFYGEESLNIRAQLDITEFDRIYLPIQNRALIHPYSDAASCAANIPCHKLEEILASKLTTLLHRRRAGDLFDLLFATMFRDRFGVSRREVVTTFLRKSVFERDVAAAREQLRAVPLESFRGLWTSLTAPLAGLFDFEFVTNNFQGLIENLFSLVAPQPAPNFGGVAVGGGARLSGGGGVAGYFPSNIRNSIVGAGRSQTMVELTYGGYQRLVEPYKLEYRVRKKDGRGLEYFWGFDTSGGSSGKTGIKQFICDEIQSVRPTTRQFSPRYPVEL